MANQCPQCNFDVDVGVKCDGCKKWLHYYCTSLPIYYLVLLKNSHFSFLCETCVVNVKCKDTFLDEHKSISADVDSMAKKRKGVVNAEIINDDELESDNSETLQHVDVNSNARELQQGPDNPAVIPKTVNHDEQVTNLLDKDRCESKDFSQQTDSQSSTPDNQEMHPPVDVTVCKFHLQGRCIHGRYGKNCRNTHPPLCKLYIKSGELGCSRSIDCTYAHPKLCTRCLRHNECKRKKCFLYHVTGSSRPNFSLNQPNDEEIKIKVSSGPKPSDVVNQVNPLSATRPKSKPSKPMNKSNPPRSDSSNIDTTMNSRSDPPNVDTTLNSFLEMLTALQSQMENVVAQQKYLSQMMMPPRWTSHQDPKTPYYHPRMSFHRPTPPQFVPPYPY